MNIEALEKEVHSVLERFEKTWTFDFEDLRKPSADVVLRDLIATTPAESQRRLSDEFFSCGPLAEIFGAVNVNEIIVNGPHDIWFEREGRMQRLPDRFLSELTYKNFIDRLCAEAGLKIDLAEPFADGRWRGYRVHLACAPLAHCSYHLTLRRLPENPWTLASLQEAGWCSPLQLEQLRALIHERKNVIVIGPTGCGKTSVLGACLKELPVEERVVVIEDTDELPRPNSASTKLLARHRLSAQLAEITLSDLVRQSLRMRPQRLVVGEVRGAEAKDLLLALATGHSGSWGTLHATEARQALIRLEMLIQLGAPQWSVHAIRQLLHLSVEALIVCTNENGHRRLEGLYRVAALESVGFLLERIA